MPCAVTGGRGGQYSTLLDPLPVSHPELYFCFIKRSNYIWPYQDNTPQKSQNKAEELSKDHQNGKAFRPLESSTLLAPNLHLDWMCK